MRALPPSTWVGSAASMAGPCSAYHSQSLAHFSISPRAWVIGLPISSVIMVAMASALSRSAWASATMAAERACNGVRFQRLKPDAARVRAASRASADSNA